MELLSQRHQFWNLETVATELEAVVTCVKVPYFSDHQNHVKLPQTKLVPLRRTIGKVLHYYGS